MKNIFDIFKKKEKIEITQEITQEETKPPVSEVIYDKQDYTSVDGLNKIKYLPANNKWRIKHHGYWLSPSGLYLQNFRFNESESFASMFDSRNDAIMMGAKVLESECYKGFDLELFKNEYGFYF